MMILIVKDSLSADRQASDRKKSNYKQMKSSMRKILTQWDDYNCEIPCDL